MADQPSPGTSNTVQPSTSSMNRKALRKARRSAVMAAGVIVVYVANNPDACAEKSTSIEPRPSEDTIKYECCICGDDFPFSDGVAHCAEHFMCNDCVVDAYNAALADTEAFPAQCCTPLPRRLVEHLLSSEVCEAYSLKAEEYYTSRTIRVYCVNEHCRSFIPKSHVDDNHALSTVARCECGTNTCVGCKHEWQGREHRCTDSEVPGVRPEWMPEYSSTYRAKSCPNCRVWMEHKEACNHMTCHYCRHSFCFVCLQPWTTEGFHQGDGCPAYGDPVEGYDGERYELSDRGLHRDTGYNRAGLNRFGQEKLSNAVAEDNPITEYYEDSDDELPDLVEYPYDDEPDNDADYGDDGEYEENEEAEEYTSEDEAEDDQADQPQHTQPSAGEVEAGQDGQANNADEVELGSAEAISGLVITGSEVNTAQDEAVSAASTAETTIVTSSDPAPAIQRRPRPSPPSDIVRQQIRLSRRVPLLAPNPHADDQVFDGGTPSFQQLECNHLWRRQPLHRTEYRYAHCQGCSYTANSWTNFCSSCGLVACDWCSYGFRARFVAQWKCATSLVDILLWAEQGVVPYKAERRQASEQLKDELWADRDGDWLGFATMIEVYETQLSELQPYLYWDFGIQLMFEELELQMRKKYCTVTEEDVGVPGLTLTFDLATNPFAPLHWDEQTQV